MKPPLPRIQSDVPRTPQAQLEVVKAIRTLMAPDEDERVRARCAEIATIRHDLEAIKRDFQKAGEECLAIAKAELRRLKLAKTYNPDQLRVPAGNRDGGQWTSGGEAGSDDSSDRSESSVSRPDSPRIQYAQASTDTTTDAAGSGNMRVTTLEDTQHDVSNVYHAVVTAGHTILGRVAEYFFDSRYFSINVIGANEVPAGNPRQPVPFLDSDNNPILVDGKPLLRPMGLPPDLYARAGMAVRSWVEDFNRDIPNVTENPETLTAMAVKILAPLAPGGPLDAERFDWTYVRDYRHYQNIMIGVYAAAAGMRVEDALSFIDLYAWPLSIFRQKEALDPVYTHSAKQDVEDTKRGYELYQSGRIRLSP